MTFYNMLRHGGTVEVKKQGYCPSTFWTEGRTIYCDTAILGNRARREDMGAKQFNKHIAQMIAEGFEVTITINRRTRT